MKIIHILSHITATLIIVQIKFTIAEKEYPAAIAEVVQTAETYFVEGLCGIKEAKTHPLINGYLTSAQGQFGVSYGNDGFFVDDFTGGIFVTMSDDDINIFEQMEVGTHVSVKGGTPICLYGTLALDGGTIEVYEDSAEGDVFELSQSAREIGAFSPIQIGQFEKPPSIPDYEGVNNNICNCLDPVSYTKGRLITVRGVMTGSLFDDSPWGWKIFLAGSGEGDIGQVFIDGASDSYVDDIRDTLLIEGTSLCVTGLVAQFSGVGWELLPRTKDDIWLC